MPKYQWFWMLQQTAPVNGAAGYGLTDEEVEALPASEIFQCPSVIRLISGATVKPLLGDDGGLVQIGVYDQKDMRALVKQGWTCIGRQNIDLDGFYATPSTTALAQPPP